MSATGDGPKLERSVPSPDTAGHQAAEPVRTERARRDGREWQRRAALAGILALAFFGRLLAIGALPVVFDEVCVMAYGISRMLDGSLKTLAFEVPIAVSNGVTPLWFWIQAGPAVLFGATSKAGLRLLPSLLGLGTVWLTHRVAGALHGGRAAIVAGVLAAVSSPYLFANARGEYSESLLVPLVLLLYRDLTAARASSLSPRSALWVALCLFTYLGKGVVIWAAYTVCVGLLCLVARGFGPRSSGSLGSFRRATSFSWLRALVLIAVPLLAPAGWLVLAQWALFRTGEPLLTELGPVRDVWTNVRRLTLGYGVETQASMVAGWREALYVYTDSAAWPTLCLIAVPAAAAILSRARDLWPGLSRADRPAMGSALVPLVLVVTPLAAILAKGALDVRFHLLYLPVLLIEAAAAIVAWWKDAEENRFARFLIWGLAGWIYVLWAQSRVAVRPVATRAAWFLLGAVLLLTAAALHIASRSSVEEQARKRRRRIARLPVASLALYAVWSGLSLGPLDWGRWSAWEPNARGQDVPRDVRSFPRPELQLAGCFLDRGEVEMARPHLRRVLEDPRADRNAILDAARPLIGEGGPDSELALRVLGDHLRRHPADGEARRLMERGFASAARPKR
jgi:hypothetical protein